MSKPMKSLSSKPSRSARRKARNARAVGREVRSLRNAERSFFPDISLELGGLAAEGYGMSGKLDKFGVSLKNSDNRKARGLDAGMVGLGTRAVDIQRPMPRLMSTMVDGVQYDRIVGTDFLTTLSSDASGNVPGDLLLSALISPTQFAQTRLYQFSQLYQRYRFRRIQFVYEPIANATQSGQIIGYADFDPDNDLLGNSINNIAIAAAHQGEAISQIWQPKVFDMEQAGSFTDLYTNPSAGDSRLAFQGVFYIIAASVIAEGLPLGNIYVDYVADFSIPYLLNNSVVAGSDWYTFLQFNTAVPGGSIMAWGSNSNTSVQLGSPVYTIGTDTITVPFLAGQTLRVAMYGVSAGTDASGSHWSCPQLTSGSTAVFSTSTTLTGTGAIDVLGSGVFAGRVLYTCSQSGNLILSLNSSAFPVTTSSSNWKVFVDLLLLSTPSMLTKNPLRRKMGFSRSEMARLKALLEDLELKETLASQETSESSLVGVVAPSKTSTSAGQCQSSRCDIACHQLPVKSEAVMMGHIYRQ